MTNGSVTRSTRRVYDSTWKKWTVFMQTYHHNPTDDQINCKDISSKQLLELLLMFVAYCVNLLRHHQLLFQEYCSGLKTPL